MKRLLLTLILISSFFGLAFSQQDQEKESFEQKQKYGIGLIPSRAGNIYGIALGPLGSEVVCGYPYYKKSHGINVQIFGQGILWVFSKWPAYANLSEKNSSNYSLDTLKKYDLLRAYHNGVMFSTFGALETNVNGITASCVFGSGNFVNGIALNLIWNRFKQVNGVSIALLNHSGTTNGLQIGLVNKSVKLKGLQIGLWNVNESRKLPIINWSSKANN